MTAKQAKMDYEYAIVGRENYEGQDGYWLEIRMKGGPGAGTIFKQLMVMSGGEPGPKRMIVQPPGQPPMEMPMGMIMGRMNPQQESTRKDLGEKVGTEMVTVPAGTFLCDHYRSASKNGDQDIWVSTKISPMGLVKMKSADVEMVLVKRLEGQTSQIKGEPRKFPAPPY